MRGLCAGTKVKETLLLPCLLVLGLYTKLNVPFLRFTSL